MEQKFIYLVKETSKHYTFQAWDRLEQAWTQASKLNRTSKELKHRSRYYVEAVLLHEREAKS